MTSTPLKPNQGHTRIPSVVLSPSPSSVSLALESEKPQDINLTLDTSQIPVPAGATHSTYHATLAKPEFWERLKAFLRSVVAPGCLYYSSKSNKWPFRTEFTTESDALIAFEDFLRASKGTLTASEIAKIRDQVGVVGMAGT